MRRNLSNPDDPTADNGRDNAGHWSMDDNSLYGHTGTPAPHSVFWDDILPWLGFAAVGGGAALAGSGVWGGAAGGASTAGGATTGGIPGAASGAGGPFSAGVPSAVTTAAPATTTAPAATTGASWISKALGTSKDLAPILGNAANNQADANRFNDTFDLRAAETNAELPDKRLSAALRAALLTNAQPFHINMPMPGAGLRGERATTTGGLDFSNLPPEVKQLMQKVMEDELNQQLAGPIHRSDTSTGDKVLGGAATAASILGALGRYWK